MPLLLITVCQSVSVEIPMHFINNVAEYPIYYSLDNAACADPDLR